MRILILNGSIHGAAGNSGLIVRRLRKTHSDVQWDLVNLKSSSYGKGLLAKLKKADAVLILTGTYWDSWGSPLQRFLEEATVLEADASVVGKPVGACVLMHSVGGKEVLSRLQGVLSTMGFLIPPMSGMAYSLSGQLSAAHRNKHAQDFWLLEDLDIIVKNLKIASEKKFNWQSWAVDRKNFRENWVR
ncbi:MAG: NAD(P)H-dependent oxidoreductase [Bdellovibrionaceae bacterium]|nr:NAD(P)H-dependent oxidoreductase [Pseudobdellovibrionaceae bacterium]